MSIKQQLWDLRAFVQAEHETMLEGLTEMWQRPLRTKLRSGHCQTIERLERRDRHTLIACLGRGESRFREGDLVCIHGGDPSHDQWMRQLSIEADEGDRWILTGKEVNGPFAVYNGGTCYADPDAMDLKPFYDKAINDLAGSRIGRETVLPLLDGTLQVDGMSEDTFDAACDAAEAEGFNEQQIAAVGCAVGAQRLACIQGPPGTGKTRVLGLIAKLLVDAGERVLLTSHTHTAINHALNTIGRFGVPAVKVGSGFSGKGLNDNIDVVERADDWHNRPDQGYVIGATPFATCSRRLESYLFDTVIFDEASQVTVPLAVMAMRKAIKYIFIGDHKQLPPVVLSKSVLDDRCYSVFAGLLHQAGRTSVCLNETYRMNAALTRWPSRSFYDGALFASDASKNRRFTLPQVPAAFPSLLSPDHSIVFVKSPGTDSQTQNDQEARQVAALIETVCNAGGDAGSVGVVTPFRNHAKRIRGLLRQALGKTVADQVVVDTVERMQGQERDMVILSLCTTDPLFLTTMADFLFQQQRLNVSVTRAKSKLILFGPEPGDDFHVAHPKVKQWVDGYRDLLRTAIHAQEVS